MDITRRSRALRGFREAGIGFAAAAAVILGASVAGRLGAFAPRLALSATALFFVVLAALAGYFVGRYRRLNIPRLLLSVDLALATGERLCSLYELRSRGGAVPLQRQIEERLAKAPPAWRQALRIRGADVFSWLAGAAAMALAVGLAVTIATSVPAAPVPMASAGSAARSEDLGQGVEAHPAGSADAGTEGVTAGRLDPGQVPPAEPLIDTLAEILSAPPSSGFLGDLTDDGVTRGNELTEDTREALSEVLSQLMGRAQADPSQSFALTEQEKTTLRDLLRSLPNSGLRQSISSLLGGETGDALKEQLAESQRLLDSLDQITGEQGNAQAGIGPEDQEAEEHGDAGESGSWVPASTSPDEDAGIAEGDGQHVEEGLAVPAMEDEGAPQFYEDEGTAGGSAGRGDAGSAPPSGAEFILEELLGSPGADGDVRRFFTKGIPFEPPTEGSEPAAALTLDYETLRALLEARALAPEVQALVRTYFETITQGEP
jgi:hypothetical protein